MGWTWDLKSAQQMRVDSDVHCPTIDGLRDGGISIVSVCNRQDVEGSNRLHYRTS